MKGMRRNRRAGWKRAVSLLLAAAMVFTGVGIVPERAQAEEANPWTKYGVSAADWMANIDGNTKISAINMPGTHDSATQYVSESTYSRCQDTSVADQLKNGIRFLDLRLGKDGEALKLIHASSTCYEDSSNKTLMLDKVLQSCYDFLDAHPTETIVASIKKDNESCTDVEFANLLYSKYITADKAKYWFLTNGNPALKDVRGKIVLVRRYYNSSDTNNDWGGNGVRIFWGDGTSKTLPWGGPFSVTGGATSFYVQDHYELIPPKKWDAVRNGLDNPPDADNRSNVYFLNFLSSTKVKIVLEVPGSPADIAKDVNSNFSNYSMQRGKAYGWIIMDFATEALARHVFESNTYTKINKDYAKDALDAVTIPQTVTADMLLPTTGKAAGATDKAADATITYSCAGNANQVRSLGTQTWLVCPMDGDLTVTVTAKVFYGGASLTKDFTVTLKKAATDLEALKKAITNAKSVYNDPSNNKYEPSTLNALKAVIDSADKLVQGGNVSSEQAAAKIKELDTALNNIALKTVEQLKTNLLGWYPLTSDSKDKSGKNNHGTATGVTFTNADGAKFSGGGPLQSVISLPTSMFDGKERMTVSFWAKDAGTEGNRNQAVFGFGSGTEPDGNGTANVYKYFLVNTNSNSKLKAVMTTNTWRSEKGFADGGAFSKNTWAYITCVFDGASFTLYKDGQLIGTIDAGVKLTDFKTNRVAYIGNSIWATRGNGADKDYIGNVKDFRVYDCAIDAKQVSWLYKNEKSADELNTELLGWYPLTQNGNDVSGKNNHGTATGVTFHATNGATFSGGNALSSYISLPTAMFDKKEKMTVSFWAKDDGTEANRNQAVFGFGSGTNPEPDTDTVYKYFLINTNKNSKLKAVVTVNSWKGEKGFPEECAFPKNTWAHITCVFDGTYLTLYKDGQFIKVENTGIKLTDLGTNRVAYIGNSIWGTRGQWPDGDFKGSVKDFRVYGCTLSADQVEQVYQYEIAEKPRLIAQLKSDIEAIEAEIKTLTQSDYTADSWNALQQAIALAKAQAENPISKAEIEQAGKNMKDKRAALKKVTFTVTFNADNGTAAVNRLVEKGTAVDRPATPKKEGHAFKGWYKDDAAAAFDFTTPITENLVLKAKWEQNQGGLEEPTIDEYTVTFDADNESLAEYVVVVSGKPVEEPADPEKPGYTFKGWYKDGAAAAFDFTTPITADLTLKAKWEQNQGGENDPTAKDPTEKDPTEKDPTEKDPTEKDPTGKDPDSTETHTVTFDADNGSAAEKKQVPSGDLIAQPVDPEKPGYTFKGWYEDGAAAAFDFTTSITGDLALKAKWEKNQGSTDDPAPANEYTVTFDADNGSASVSVKVKSGNTVTKPADPKKEGYAFKGWYKDGAAAAFDFATPITADIALKAKWEQNQGGGTQEPPAGEYTVTFDADDGSPLASVKVKSGNTVAKPEDPKKEGYRFIGWHPAGASEKFDFQAPITKDWILIANWEKEQVSENPNDPDDPKDPGKPGDTEEPGNTEEPGGTEEPGNTEEPGDTEDPGDTEEPGDTEDPGDTEEPEEPEEIEFADVSIAKAVYTGKALKPKVKVSYDGEDLILGKDYALTYKNNTKIGQGSVTITGIGSFIGKMTLKFYILPKKNKISVLSNQPGRKLVVKFSKASGAKGYEISYAINKSMKSARKIRTNKTAYTLKNLKKGKTYYIRVRSYVKIGKKIKYSDYSPIAVKKIKK